MPQIREAVGVFDDLKKLDAAVAELEVTAFPRQDISVLGTEKELESKYGHEVVKLEWLEDMPDSPRSAPIRPEEKTIGAGVLIGCCAYAAGCAAAIMAKDASIFLMLAAIASGSMLGAWLGTMIVLIVGVKLRNGIAKQLQNGGLLLWVRTPGPKREQIAQKILLKHGAKHVHIHSIV